MSAGDVLPPGPWRLPPRSVLVLTAAALAGALALVWSGGTALINRGEVAIMMEGPLADEPEYQVSSADVTVAWKLETDAILGTEIVADIGIPERRQMMRLSIRKNSDPDFPASHVVEFSADPSSYPDRDIAEVPSLSLKDRPENVGDALIGAPVKVADNKFWIALSAAADAVRANVALLRAKNILYLSLRYANGRQAAIGLEKGASGRRVFDEAFAAWDAPAP